MNFEQQVIFLFSALGAFNGLVLSAYFLFITKSKGLPTRLLGGLLLVLSIRIIKSVFFYFNPNLFEVFIQIGLLACSLIGPFLLVYVLSVTQKNHRLQQRWWWYVLPFAILVSVLSIRYPYYEYRHLWRGSNGWVKLIYRQWFVFILLTAIPMRQTIQKLLIPKLKLRDQEIWLLNIYFGIAFIWLAYWTTAYTSYITAALSFSLVIYLSILLWVLKRRRDINFYEKPVKYANRTISQGEATAISQKLQAIFKEQELYKDPNLKLDDVAGAVQLSRHQLSQFLNDNLDKSFNQFINEHRIEAAKSLLHTNRHFTAEAVGYDCGFNSKSTFFSTFKRVVGCTPAVYREQAEKHS